MRLCIHISWFHRLIKSIYLFILYVCVHLKSCFQKKSCKSCPTQVNADPSPLTSGWRQLEICEWSQAERLKHRLAAVTSSTSDPRAAVWGDPATKFRGAQTPITAPGARLDPCGESYLPGCGIWPLTSDLTPPSRPPSPPALLRLQPASL